MTATDPTYRELMDARKARMARNRLFTTADGHPIVDGGLYWNNDLDVIRVSFDATSSRRPGGIDSPDFDGWFRGVDPETGAPRGIWNAERLAKVNPFDRQSADAAYAARSAQS